MTPAPLHLAGERLMLDPAGVVSWPARQTLIVSDLHLEKGSHFAARGRFVPPYDTRETLAKLALAVRRYGPARLVLLGDSFHDPLGCDRMAPADCAALQRILGAVEEVVWVLGNHDPVAPRGLPGTALEALVDGPLTFRHEADPRTGGELSGHFHPKATLATRAGGISRPCFATDARRVILPSFGAYTGGLDVRDPALGGLFPRGGRVFLLGPDRLFSVPMAPMRRRAEPVA
ncbi:ligase-associated DNA damage response endonuclease PdeM [Pararoseomonas sp. SCSIO 73927]|uniref:ligase-associated DNA damage response endonuclease PdeM n=1 Tax=Pararoseomonas sp. SCSIO 73927 TaxID=3114537 RepID=UPI0030D3E883